MKKLSRIHIFLNEPHNRMKVMLPAMIIYIIAISLGFFEATNFTKWFMLFSSLYLVFTVMLIAWSDQIRTENEFDNKMNKWLKK